MTSTREPGEDPARLRGRSSASSSEPRARRLLRESAGVAAIAWLWASLQFQIWNMPLHLPFDTRSDAQLISMIVKTIEERGWYYNQPRLGAPFGQVFYDFPHGGESFQLAAMKVLVTLTGDWGLAMNLYFLLGIGFLAAVTYAVLRHLRFSPPIAAAAALIYSFLPYHFVHGQAHLWRSTYYSAPLAGLLLVWVASYRERFFLDARIVGWRTLRTNLHRRRALAAVLVAVVIAGTETMTTAFTMTLLVSGSIVWAIRWRDARRLVVAAVLVVVMGSTFAVLSYPTLNFYRAHGTNEIAARRLVTESELYGLKISRLVTPEIGHRSETMSSIGELGQADSSVPSEDGQALGVLGTAGFLGALYAAIAGRRRTVSGWDLLPGWDRAALRDHAAVYTVLALLFGVIGGLSVIAGMVGFSQVRVWNRMVVLIAFFAMVVAAMAGEWLAATIRARRPPGRALLGSLAILVVAFGLWDSIPPIREPYARIEARHANDRAFVADIEELMQDGAAIFQVPVLPFPEVKPAGRMVDYDPLRGYLADSGTLRWSYGSIKGRPAGDWQTRLRDHVGPKAALPGLLGLGFTGLWVDTWGYTDGGIEVRHIAETLGVEPIISPDKRFIFYDLRLYRHRLDASDAELQDAARDLFGVEPLTQAREPLQGWGRAPRLDPSSHSWRDLFGSRSIRDQDRNRA